MHNSLIRLEGYPCGHKIDVFFDSTNWVLVQRNSDNNKEFVQAVKYYNRQWYLDWSGEWILISTNSLIKQLNKLLE